MKKKKTDYAIVKVLKLIKILSIKLNIEVMASVIEKYEHIQENYFKNLLFFRLC